MKNKIKEACGISSLSLILNSSRIKKNQSELELAYQAQLKGSGGQNKPGQELLYQYRSFEGFWNIIKSDSFWATNARFSNDKQEQSFGIDMIKKCLLVQNIRSLK